MAALSRTEEFFVVLPSRLNPVLARSVNTAIRFDLEGNDGGSWTVRIAEGACEVIRGSQAPVALSLGLGVKDLFSMADGELVPMEAYTNERVSVNGDIGLAMQLLELFNVGAASVPYLIPLLQSGDVEARLYGLEALGLSGARNVAPAVKRLLDDADERVRAAAARTLEAVSERAPKMPPTLSRDPALGGLM